jgi:Ulp1 protease family, C-terminal catalytic domain
MSYHCDALPESAEVDFAWIPPAVLSYNILADFGTDLLFIDEFPHCEVARVRLRDDLQYSHRRLIFTPSDIQCLADREGWLNDICINQCASLLYHYCESHSKQTCAIFSSFDIHSVRDDLDEDQIWRSVCHVEYWRRTTWLIPLHDHSHWLLCVVDTQQNEILCFDSFGDSMPWEGSLLQVSRCCSPSLVSDHHLCI